MRESIISDRTMLRLNILLIVLCVVSACWVPFGLFFKPGVTAENFDRLSMDMHRRQVEAILGPGAGYKIYVTGGYIQSWHGQDHTIVLSFGGDHGRCLMEGDLQKNGKIIKEVRLTAPSWWAQVRLSLGF